jgi:hypothetical protein
LVPHIVSFVVQILDTILGNWQASDTLRSTHADMDAKDVDLMTTWLRRHHTITLKPFLKVTRSTCGTSSMIGINASLQSFPGVERIY